MRAERLRRLAGLVGVLALLLFLTAIWLSNDSLASKLGATGILVVGLAVGLAFAAGERRKRE